MQPLDMGSARALLQRELPVGHKCPINFYESLEMILKSCECHPLAIVNMAWHIRDTGFQRYWFWKKFSLPPPILLQAKPANLPPKFWKPDT